MRYVLLVGQRLGAGGDLARGGAVADGQRQPGGVGEQDVDLLHVAVADEEHGQSVGESARVFVVERARQ